MDRIKAEPVSAILRLYTFLPLEGEGASIQWKIDANQKI